MMACRPHRPLGWCTRGKCCYWSGSYRADRPPATEPETERGPCRRWRWPKRARRADRQGRSWSSGRVSRD